MALSSSTLLALTEHDVHDETDVRDGYGTAGGHDVWLVSCALKKGSAERGGSI